jgi:cbb3-type cytochrome oxidase maturation protein
MMLGASIFLGSIALVAFLWGLKTGQFDDEEKMMNTVRFDSDEDLREAAELQKRKEELKKKKKEYKPE